MNTQSHRQRGHHESIGPSGNYYPQHGAGTYTAPQQPPRQHQHRGQQARRQQPNTSYNQGRDDSVCGLLAHYCPFARRFSATWLSLVEEPGVSWSRLRGRGLAFGVGFGTAQAPSNQKPRTMQRDRRHGNVPNVVSWSGALPEQSTGECKFCFGCTSFSYISHVLSYKSQVSCVGHRPCKRRHAACLWVQFLRPWALCPHFALPWLVARPELLSALCSIRCRSSSVRRLTGTGDCDCHPQPPAPASSQGGAAGPGAGALALGAGGWGLGAQAGPQRCRRQERQCQLANCTPMANGLRGHDGVQGEAGAGPCPRPRPSYTHTHTHWCWLNLLGLC
jgi:hypothetical protein